VPAERSRHRLVGFERQRRFEASRTEHDRLGHGPAERPGRTKVGRENDMIIGLRGDRPRPFEYGAVDGMGRQVEWELDVVAAKREAAVTDASSEWRHGVAAPADRAPALCQEDLPFADPQ
jgi:hypothetical protein